MRAFTLFFIWFALNTSTMEINGELTQDIPWYYPTAWFRSTYHNYCKVKDLRMFDLSLFMYDDPVDDWYHPDEHTILRMKFCEPLVRPCNGKNGYRICLHKNGTEVGVGSEPPQIELSDSSVIFKFTGDTCNATHNYTINLKLKCNRIMHSAGLLDFKNWTENCHHDVQILTSTVCPKKSVEVKLNDDKFQDANVLISDLCDLDRRFGPHFFEVDAKNHTFHFDFCGERKVCNDSYICDDEMSYGRNVTITADDPTDMIKFHFTNGSQCADGSNAQSVFYIKCKPDTLFERFTVLSDQYCSPELKWSTDSICPPVPPYLNFWDAVKYCPNIRLQCTIMLFLLSSFAIVTLVLLYIDPIKSFVEKFMRKLIHISVSPSILSAGAPRNEVPPRDSVSHCR